MKYLIGAKKSGIDTWSKEFKQANGLLDEAVAPIDGEILLQLYKNVNKIDSLTEN